ncbi:MAG: universal stress protein [Gemmatimonadetes bacterium]|nr:universal stress protein [Gemmatimonadota bacterium]
MLKKILVPVDGSAFGESALPVALELSRRADADVRLAMVNQPAGLIGGWEEAFQSTHITYLESLEGKVAKVAARPVSTALLDGDVPDALCQEAQRSDSDLIVMSTHGRGGLTRMWLGSVADAVVRRSSTPVLLVRPPEGEAPFLEVEEPKIRRVLIPLEGSTLSEGAIEPALELGALFGASFTLLRVIAFPFMGGSFLPETLQTNRSILEEAETEARAYLEGVRSNLDDGSRRIDIDVVVNQQPARGILDYAAANNVDLVSIATHGRGGVERTLLGSTADKVIRGADTPTLIVRPLNKEAASLTESVA